ncbi:MAG: hypothetical protein JXR86_17615 [Spirochaetales bacterium]|nr:hypothetical protein [Spirochaetales bacterium]
MKKNPGYFGENGKNYILESNRPPREWKNAHFSGPGGKYRYWTRFSNTGSGYSFCVDKEGNHCTLVPDQGKKTIWFRDEETREVFSIAGFPVPTEVTDYTCIFTQGSTTISSRFDNMEFSWRCFVPLGEACEIWTVEIKNESKKTRNFSLFPYAEIQIDGFDCPYAYGNWHKRVEFDKAGQSMKARNLYPNPNPALFGAMLISSREPIGGAGGNEAFFAPSYSYSHPRLVLGENLEQKDFAHDESGEALSLQVKISIEPGGYERLDFSLGILGETVENARMLKLLKDPSAVDKLLSFRDKCEEKLIDSSWIYTGDKRVDYQFNYWLKKQMHSYLVYKTGVRDNLQTFMAYCTIDREETEKQFLQLLSCQYSDGSFPHSWSPLNEKLYSDKPAWLLFTLPALIKESGDLKFMNRMVSFSNGEEATVLEHLLRAFNYLKKDKGRNGFNLIHTADWNDDLDGPGLKDGESLLVTQIFCAGIRECIPLLERLELKSEMMDFLQTFNELRELLNKIGWDGEWYLRALDGEGGKVGSRENSEGRIYLNSQAWAIISGTAPEERQKEILKNVDRYLDTPLGLKVLDPTYTSFDPSVGSLSAALPGFYVNGIYVHANMFMIMADFMSGRANLGWERIQKILPDSEKNPSTNSQCEPFSITNCYRSDDLRPGLCGDVWHSGSPAWLHLILMEYMAGIRRDYDGLIIDPCLPAELDEIRLERVFRGCRYIISLSKREENKRRETRGCHTILRNGIPYPAHLLMHNTGNIIENIEVII